MSTPGTLAYLQEQACEFLTILGTRGVPRSRVKKLLSGLLHLSVLVHAPEDQEGATKAFCFCAQEFAVRDLLMSNHNMWPDEASKCAQGGKTT